MIYARVATANKFMHPELSCTVLNGVKKDWVTGQSIYGELHGGFNFVCTTGLARRYLSHSPLQYICRHQTLTSMPECANRSLLRERSPVLETLGATLPFEGDRGANKQAAFDIVTCLCIDLVPLSCRWVQWQWV